MHIIEKGKNVRIDIPRDQISHLKPYGISQEVRGTCNWEFQLPGKEKNSVNSFPKTLHSSLIKSGNLNIQVYIGLKKTATGNGLCTTLFLRNLLIS